LWGNFTPQDHDPLFAGGGSGFSFGGGGATGVVLLTSIIACLIAPGCCACMSSSLRKRYITSKKIFWQILFIQIAKRYTFGYIS
jgi:hypothetical protein